MKLMSSWTLSQALGIEDVKFQIFITIHKAISEKQIL